MLQFVNIYLWEEVRPRAVDILKHGNFITALLVFLGTALWGDLFIAPKLQVGAFILALVAYDAIALAFSIAALTLVICNPSAEVAVFFATRDDKLPDEDSAHFHAHTNAFSNLLFVFSWTAVVHWIFFVMSVVALILVNSERNLTEDFSTIFGRVVIGASFGMALYCFLQFLTAIITLSLFGRLYILKLRKMERERNKPVTTHAAVPTTGTPN